VTANITPRLRPFSESLATFDSGTDTPRKFLERCIEVINAGEPQIRAFVTTNFTGARAAADASTARWASHKPLSIIDGMPVAVKDIIETADMPTEQGSPLFTGWRGGRDAAAVAALREAGAVVIGKTVTTEFAAAQARGTRNPWDLTRTPGGSSSGSAAAVGAGMVPAGLGTQVVGSAIRPASFCGCFGYKPSVGGINRGGSFDEFSQSCTSILAAGLSESWCVAHEISARAGGDPGYPGIYGPPGLPSPVKPKRIAILQTGGWADATDEARHALRDACSRIEKSGIEFIDRTTDKVVDAVEVAILNAYQLTMDINAWEGRWPLNTYVRDMEQSKLSKSALGRLATGNRISLGVYRELIAERQRIRNSYAALKNVCDLCVTLSATSEATTGIESTGNPVFAVPASLLGTPSISLPVLRAAGLPLGLQLICFADNDASMFAAAAAILPLFAVSSGNWGGSKTL
jgi:Asp-tRNA(Asn)/Glu-tRNA(Gln) amidotransferase A subunit family amidase